MKPATEEQSEEGDEGSSAPTLERLWAFSCELTKGRNITSMAWNKKSLVTHAENQRAELLSVKSRTNSAHQHHCHFVFAKAEILDSHLTAFPLHMQHSVQILIMLIYLQFALNHTLTTTTRIDCVKHVMLK